VPEKTLAQVRPLPPESITPPARSRNWIERLWFTIADRGRGFAAIPSKHFNARIAVGAR
jgi:hypothetical protein